MKEIRNRVAESNLVTLEMKSFRGGQVRESIDISKWLYNEMVLKEKLYREYLENHKWEEYENKFVAIHCSQDVIVPIWAYMLVTKYLKPYTNHIVFGDQKSLENKIFEINIEALDLKKFKDKRVLIKGCTDTYIPEKSYVQISNKLIGVVKSLMFGEACSNVPIYKSN